MSLPWKSREPDTFLDTFKPEEPAGPLKDTLAPNSSHGTGTNIGNYRSGRWNKNFEFSGVQQDEKVIAATLQTVEDDMLARVKASGADIQGVVRLTCVQGVLRKFEFDYRHHGKNGTVSGEVRPCEHKGGVGSGVCGVGGN